jgi:hypothetical protein
MHACMHACMNTSPGKRRRMFKNIHTYIHAACIHTSYFRLCRHIKKCLYIHKYIHVRTETNIHTHSHSRRHIMDVKTGVPSSCIQVPPRAFILSPILKYCGFQFWVRVADVCTHVTNFEYWRKLFALWETLMFHAYLWALIRLFVRGYACMYACM